MVRDDANSPQTEPLRRTPLARLIAGAPGGLVSDRVVRWAGDLAAEIDRRLDRGGRHGSIDTDHIVIDQYDRARLETGRGERDLLLGTAPDSRTDDVRALAATLYEALAGRPPDAEAAPIAGVEVRINMGLLAALGPKRGGRPRRVSELVAILEGTRDVAPAGPLRTASPSGRAAPPALSVAAGLAVVTAVSFGAWIWPGGRGADRPAPAPGAAVEQRPLARDAAALRRAGVAAEMADVGRDMSVAAAQRAQLAWQDVAARRPAQLFDDLRRQADTIAATAAAAGDLMQDGRHDEARALFEQATVAMTTLIAEHDDASRVAASSLDRWRDAVAAGPEQWSTDGAVQLDCADAEALAAVGRRQQEAGRFEEAGRTLDQAVELRQAALARHESRIEDLLDQLQRDRAEGRFEDAIADLDQLAAYRDPARIRARRIETYLAWARARNSRASRGEARRAVDALLALAPDNVEGLALRRRIATYWQARGGDLLVNSLSQTLVLVEPGSFEMGSPRTELFHQRSELQHAVRLTQSYWITRIEVTRGQFAAFVAATGRVTDAESAGWSLGLGPEGQWRRVEAISWRDPGFPQSDNHPVVCVSWKDATAFCDWLSGVEGRAYRLPTEAQWEYACRAGSEEAYAWGNDPYRDRALTNGADEAWMGRFPDTVGFAWSDGHVFTAPVAEFPANAWGLFDMHGNVQEWCRDVYGPYDPSTATDPVGPPAAPGERPPRVLRGGSFASAPAACRAAHRDASDPDSSFVTVGFRVVLQD